MSVQVRVLTSQVIRKAAFDIEAIAKQRSRVDTGAMRSGWQATSISDLVWDVINPLEHAIYNEFGTRGMAAQPMARPAAVEVFPQLVAGLRKAYETGLGRG